MKSIAALILWSTSLALYAQGVPPGPPPHRPGPPMHAARVPSPEALATIPNLSATQQTELRKILLDSRDAHEAVDAKARTEFDALAKKTRAEHERIEEQRAQRLRRLLGDDGFRRFAEWQLAHGHGHRHGYGRGRGRAQGMQGPPRGPRRPGPDGRAGGPDAGMDGSGN